MRALVSETPKTQNVLFVGIKNEEIVMKFGKYGGLWMGERLPKIVCNVMSSISLHRDICVLPLLLFRLGFKIGWNE